MLPENPTSLTIEPIAETAKQEESEIIGIRDKVELNFLLLGKRLASFAERELYRGLNYSSMDKWLDSPRVGIGRMTGWKLIRVWRSFGQIEGLQAPVVAAAGRDKLALLAPHVEAGEIDPLHAVEMASEYSVRDLEARFRKPRADTVKVECPTCHRPIAESKANWR